MLKAAFQDRSSPHPARYARDAEDLFRQLAGPRPTAVERLLAEQVAILWVHVRLAEVIADLAFHEADCSLRWRDYCDRRADRFRRRYVQALKALADVRRLDLTLIQAAAANMQFNVSGTLPVEVIP